MCLAVFLIAGCSQDRYRLFLPEIKSEELKFAPEFYAGKPDLPSPAMSESGRELVLVRTSENQYTWFDATVENGDPFNYKDQQYGKGNQLMADAADFPGLSRTGFHADRELVETKTITGRSVSQITVDGRPWGSSGVGFMTEDETIMSVIWADNQTAGRLGLSHPDLARPLFHLWNLSREMGHYNADRAKDHKLHLNAMIYHGNEVQVKITGSRGWQESIFDDEILGSGHFEMWREPDEEEKAFLKQHYGQLPQEQYDTLHTMLFHIHTGEMVFFYINRYGFYEGHTEYRADPVSIALVFGLKSIESVHESIGGDLYSYFMTPFTKNPE